MRSWRYRFTFAALTLAAFFLLTLAAYPLLHPYFRDRAFYAVELILVALLLLAGGFAVASHSKSALAISAVGGYFIGVVSYLFKWAFFDAHANPSSHLAQVGTSIFSAAPWFSAVFTYDWLFLPLAIMAGRWLTTHLTNAGVSIVR